jgi:hypothetical protein
VIREWWQRKRIEWRWLWLMQRRAWIRTSIVLEDDAWRKKLLAWKLTPIDRELAEIEREHPADRA